MANETHIVRFLNYAGTDLLGTAEVEHGGDATSQAPTPEIITGKQFTGWNMDITCVLEDMTVRPVYADLTFTVIFKGYSGTTLKTETVAYGHDATPPTPEIVPGHTFSHWDTNYTNVTQDLTVNAVYSANYYTVSFMNKTGTTVRSQQQIAYGGDAFPPAPEKVSGFTFIGWSASFRYITEDKTISPVYREIPPNPRLSIYTQNADGSCGSLVKTYSAVNDCSISQKLSGECSLDVKLVTKQTEGFVEAGRLAEVEGLIFTITEVKKNISSGICYTQFSGDHVSYLLNNEEYEVDAFDMTDTPTDILRTLLTDTPFTVGDVDPVAEVTLRVNNNSTRRACLMQLLALCDGEIEYEGYSIGIRSHVGEETPIEIMQTSLVQDISFSNNATENVTNYTLSLYQKGSLTIGDELHIVFSKLGINAYSRIVGMDWNPFNYKEVSITVGQYIPTINETLYQLETTVEDIRQTTAKYTVEFGEMVGNGSFFFTRSYLDRPLFHLHCDDDSDPTVTLLREGGSVFGAYIGAQLSGVSTETVTLLVFYCTVPDESEED